MRKRKSPVALCLLRNSKAAMIAAIEIHNKPLFPYRYEVCVLLIINAWELLLKAYIYKFHKEVKLFRKDGTTKDFKQCVTFIASNSGKNFQVVKESLERLYEYRNSAAHFYWENLDLMLYSLIKANVIFYVDFIRRHFKVDISKEINLVLLPIGFTKPYSPIDFLFNESSLTTASNEVKRFVQSIIESSRRLQDAGIEESIVVDYKMNLTNESRIKNADIIAGINSTNPQGNVIVVQNILDNYKLTDDPNAREIRVSEDSLFSLVFTEQFSDVVSEARKRFADFKQNAKFYSILAEIKKNPELNKARYLDPNKPTSGRKDFYSKKVYEELSKYYKAKDKMEKHL